MYGYLKSSCLNIFIKSKYFFNNNNKKLYSFYLNTYLNFFKICIKNWLNTFFLFSILSILSTIYIAYRVGFFKRLNIQNNNSTPSKKCHVMLYIFFCCSSPLFVQCYCFITILVEKFAKIHMLKITIFLSSSGQCHA